MKTSQEVRLKSTRQYLSIKKNKQANSTHKLSSYVTTMVVL